MKFDRSTRGFELATPVALAAIPADERHRTVVIVQDAFTSFYDTGLVLDTLELLSGLGFRPLLSVYQPNGKPAHVHGFLKDFERIARAHAKQLHSYAATGIPLVGIDPSITLTFRSEYVEALGMKAVPKVQLLQEWLADRMRSGSATTGKHYTLLAHCTERAIAQSSLHDWVRIFSSFGLGLNIASVGCCGMAGTYGHERRNAATSRVIFDMSWRRQIEEAHQSEEVLATGYSCRSQAKRFANANLRHPVQVLLQHLSQVDAGRTFPEVRHAG